MPLHGYHLRRAAGLEGRDGAVRNETARQPRLVGYLDLSDPTLAPRVPRRTSRSRTGSGRKNLRAVG